MRVDSQVRAGHRSGFSLIELLIAMTMLLAITAAAWSLFQSQSKNFRGNIDRWEMIQNARSALEGAQRVIRTMGSGTPPGQPILVYGANNVLAFNTDYIERDTSDMRWAAYFNPDTPAGEALVWDVSAASTIPNSSPSYVYPSKTYTLSSGTNSPAETYIFYFSSDSSTTRDDDYVLWQRVNGGTPEVVARNILAHPNGSPFFEYVMKRSLSTGDTLLIVPTANLPLARRALVSGLSNSEKEDYVRPDSVRGVRMNFRLTNGRTGVDERFRDMTTMVQVPNNGIQLPLVCGRVPLAPGTLSAVEAIPGSGRVTLTWPSSVDQDGGEVDVLQYILYRRLTSTTAWGGPLMVVKAEAGRTSYSADILDNIVGTPYTFGILAQDCTPSQSNFTTASITP